MNTTLPPRTTSVLTRLWRLPTLTVARFTLRSYIRSGWILGDIIFIWLAYAIFYLEFGGDVAYFFGTAGEALGVLSILSTIVITQRALNARVYLPLARLLSRSSYIRGVILATSLLRVPAFLLLMLLAMSFHRFSPPPCNPLCIANATVGGMTVGAVGLLINCTILAILTVLLSIPIATRRIQIAFVAWLALVLYTNTSNDVVALYLGWVRLPLAPMTVCYNLATTNGISWYTLVMIALALGYIGALIALTETLLRKRDLILL